MDWNRWWWWWWNWTLVLVLLMFLSGWIWRWWRWSNAFGCKEGRIGGWTVGFNKIKERYSQIVWNGSRRYCWLNFFFFFFTYPIPILFSFLIPFLVDGMLLGWRSMRRFWWNWEWRERRIRFDHFIFNRIEHYYLLFLDTTIIWWQWWWWRRKRSWLICNHP